MIMEKQSLESSVVRAAGYTYVLEIEFQSGRIYQYFDVPEGIYNAFLDSESKGKYFNAHIRGKFPYREIEIKQKEQAQH
jgi:hypothetical protein